MENAKAKKTRVVSGNHAAATIAYAMSEAAAIYPITPSSDMAELCDAMAAKGDKNIFGTIPRVVQLQSEAGAAGTLHGIMAGGALATTFTASQGLLLMIPNMYKIAGELLPCVMHVSARSVASHALSIFGDHSDVMAVRSTGWAMLCSSSVQEAQDMALIAHLASIQGSYPVLHFFDGFRTSHEINKIETIDNATIKKLVKDLKLDDKIKKFRNRALNPNHPHQAGTAQNPDTFFQNREACNPYVDNMGDIVHNIMCKVGEATGRHYKPFEYIGGAAAKHIIVAMGSACETIEEYITDKPDLGLVKVRLYRPFDMKYFFSVLPPSVETGTVLDRTKENGAVGDPLYTDFCAVRIADYMQRGHSNISMYAGRYGLGSKEFTPAMVAAVYANAASKSPKNHFTVGINDDVSGTSLPIPTPPSPHGDATPSELRKTECVFYGLGSDGTVGANRNSTSIIGDNTNLHAQAYFVFDSKKSGGTTISHLRFSDKPIKSTYLVNSPCFVACHNQTFLTKFDMLAGIKKGGTFLLNTTYSAEELENILPANVKRTLHEREVKFYIINAYKIAAELGLQQRINTIMQSAFFKLTDIIPYKNAVGFMKAAIDKSYGKKGGTILEMNYAAVDSAESNLQKIEIPTTWAAATDPSHPAQKNSLDFSPCQVGCCKSTEEYYKCFCKPINRLQGNELPVSAFNPDGRVPTATGQYEKRNIATSLPEWIAKNCIQCNHCVLVCPHATIRAHLATPAELEKAPKTFNTLKANGFDTNLYKIQLNPHDCTGCGSCANVCPTREKALIMRPFNQVDEAANYKFSLKLPYPEIEPNNVKNSQFLRPYFEFSGACAGCGETPYIKLVTQLFGNRMIIANSTGCTSIYGGSSPTCPYTVDRGGRGPAWANSLFEDTAEFGYGIKLAYDVRNGGAGGARRGEAPRESVWIIGGDGWAYDIGYGGLDHVLAQNEDVNILVLDTEVYSNTGGQSSKSTPSGAIAKFASAGKLTNKKDLGAMAMNYENVYVAQIALGANYAQTLTAIKEAEAHKGPSLIIAYSTCIGHGIDMSNGMKTMKNAVDSGYWTLYRRKPATDDKPAEFILDSGEPKMPYKEFLANETRYKALEKADPEAAKKLFEQAELHAKRRYEKYKKMAGI